jgi:hypothetical protein
MSAKIWMKWLSVIALILIALDWITIIYSIILVEPGNGIMATDLGVLLLAIVAVIISFSKKK